MRNKITLYEPEKTTNQRFNTLAVVHNTTVELNEIRKTSEIFTSEGREGVYDYVERLGLGKDPNLVVLSSLHHYYYDYDEMKNVKTVVNLKELNRIHNLNSFIHSLFRIIQPRCFFVGCFIDNRNNNIYDLKNDPSQKSPEKYEDQIEDGILSKIPFLNMIYSKLDMRRINILTRRTVNMTFSERGFKIVDMTEINGITFFCAQRSPDLSN